MGEHRSPLHQMGGHKGGPYIFKITEMMRKYLLSFILITCLLLTGTKEIFAQSLPVGTPGLGDAYRRAQLLGLVDSSVSFCARPFFPIFSLQSKDSFDPFITLDSNRLTKFNGIFKLGGDKVMFKLLPVTLINQYNSKHPERSE